MKRLDYTKVSVKLKKSEWRDEWFIYLEAYPVYETGNDKPIRVREYLRRLFYCRLKFLKTIVVGLMSTKPGSMPALVLPILTVVQNISKLAFLPLQKDCKANIESLPPLLEVVPLLT